MGELVLVSYGLFNAYLVCVVPFFDGGCQLLCLCQVLHVEVNAVSGVWAEQFFSFACVKF